MSKGNYTLEELTDLLLTQVVLTLVNDGEFYRKAYKNIDARDYIGFCNAMITHIRAVASYVMPDADFVPTLRSVVMLWDYYTKDESPTSVMSSQYSADMKKIATNNREMLVESKPKSKEWSSPIDPGAGFKSISFEEARDLKFTAEYFNVHIGEWRSCRYVDFLSSCASFFIYRAPAHVMQQPQPQPLPETPKEITMSSFDKTIPVANVTLIYGLSAKSYTEGDLLAAVRRIDDDIATFEKSGIRSTRIWASIAKKKAEREAIIKAFDEAAESADDTTSDSATV
jgi:hypothetical protein